MNTGFLWAGPPVLAGLSPAPVPPSLLGKEVEEREWAASGLWHGQQGRAPHCAAYTWLHWRAVHDKAQRPAVEPRLLYRHARLLVKAKLPPQGLSLVHVYRAMEGRGLAGPLYRLDNLDDVAHALRGTGPVLVGSDWLAGMQAPTMQPQGKRLGAHAYLLDGWTHGMGTVRNSLSQQRQQLYLDGLAGLRWEAWLALP